MTVLTCKLAILPLVPVSFDLSAKVLERNKTLLKYITKK